MHASETLLSQFSLKLKIVSNSARMQALDTLLSNIFCSSKLFQILSECKLKRPCFQIFFSVPNRSKWCQNAGSI